MKTRDLEALRRNMDELWRNYGDTDFEKWPEEQRTAYETAFDRYWSERLKQRKREELRKEKRLAAGGVWTGNDGDDGVE